MKLNITIDDRCIALPPKVNSMGFRNDYMKNHVMQYAMPQLELQMVLVFALTHLCHFFLKRLGVTSFVSQLVAGIIIAMTVQNERMMRHLFPMQGLEQSHSQAVLDVAEFFGYALFFFLTGVKMDISMVFKVGRKAWVIGILSSTLPLLFCFPILGYFANTLHLDRRKFLDLSTLSGIQSFTAFPVIYCLLSDLKVLNTELGRLALSSSLVSYSVCIIWSYITLMSEVPKDMKLKYLGMTVSFLAVVVLILRPVMKWMIRQTPEGKPVKDKFLHIVVVTIFLCSVYSDLFGQSVIFGAFMLGLAVPDGPPLGSAIVDKLESFFLGILMPLYVTVSIVKVDFDSLFPDLPKMKLELFIIAFVFIVKLIFSIVPPFLCNLPVNDAITIGLILNCKGIVELGTFRLLVEMKRFSNERYALAVMALLINSTVLPLFVRRLLNNSRNYGGYQKRNIMNLKSDARLSVLACIHRTDNIEPMIRVINTCQSRENIVSVYVLHLIKMISQATPIFISHQVQKKVDGNKSYSDNVIMAFNNFTRGSSGTIEASMFTAVSPPKLMHEDICYLALDKNVSLIVLPFHKRWSHVDGSIEYEDTQLRNLNSSVLQRAPCSVGILIDRGHRGFEEDTTFTIGLFFLGGSDDREALALAKRMAMNPAIHLRIVQIRSSENDNHLALNWEGIMDAEMLRDVKEKNAYKNITCTMETVESGPGTAKVVKEMVYEFNLVIVGRRFGVECQETSGLHEWAELPELGILGDLLASSDLETKASVLIIQQQLQHRNS
ncbi:hypothetical protein MLD38_017474 [Melastoma candidum]|uniref:Uncharacterized protein n=1 Tax=Melastoma candidum TaxID=119954 RepID=A0ACB9QYZ2_9MYRT|nr:hypothetical protein MLD38_017474 [Melastoma candidum]